MIKNYIFSLQVDETTDVTCGWWWRGREIRGILFYDVSCGRAADHLFKLLIETFSQNDIKHKLVAQRFDEAAVMAGQLNGLQTKIKQLLLKHSSLTVMLMSYI
jgi:hypothetical protein